MEHGPQMHGVLLGLVVLIAVVGGLVYLVVDRVKRRRHSNRDPASDQSRER